uniref:BZIP domain-containing protein n=1 Tax=Grammatophora oceanica TaxID=210454 RepID=A0A7S1YBV2_9STRA
MSHTYANPAAALPTGLPDIPTTLSKRPLMTTTKDGKALSDKKLRRLARNRESARQCRKRKREETENLQREIAILEGENLRLRLQLQIGQEAEDSLQDEQGRVTTELDALLKSGASEADIFSTIEAFKEKFADYGRDRRSAIAFHLQNVERLLMPTQTTSVVMNAIEGASTADAQAPPQLPWESPSSTDTNGSVAAIPAAALPPAATVGETTTPSEPTSGGIATVVSSDNLSKQANLEPKSLFKYLVTHLKVSPEQAMALRDSRLVAKELDDCLAQSTTLLGELRQRCAQVGEDLETEFDHVRAILTPTQAAKFLVWVANNQACMHMLNELWHRDHGSASPAPPEDPLAADGEAAVQPAPSSPSASHVG